MQISNFSELHLSSEIMKGIKEMGWETPSPIQAHSIGPLLDGRDILGQAQTGTGKTAAFGIPMVELVDPNLKYVQGLILAPTRELAVQITDHLRRLARYRGVKILAIYGGESMQRQTRALKDVAHIVVGTPGRILDHLARGNLNLKRAKIVVLDEADRMLDMGFIDDIRRVLSTTPRDKQISLFSATLDRNVMQISGEFLRHPEKIIVSKDEIALPQIRQHYVEVEPIDKFRVLLSILEEYRVKRAIIFCKTQHGATRLAKMLATKRQNADALHGGLSQAQRDSVVDSFRRGKLKLLVASDVASRGLDIRDVTHIINHNIPNEPHVYFHRIGRTARMEADGDAISLVSQDEMKSLNRIRAITRTQITELKGKHTAITNAPKIPGHKCGKCGAEFSATFTPKGDYPVYCPTCYQNHQKAMRKGRQRNVN